MRLDSRKVNATSTLSRLVLLVAIVTICLAVPNHAQAEEKYLVFDYRELINRSSSWPAADKAAVTTLPSKTSTPIGPDYRISHVIIPNKSTPWSSYQNWVIIEKAESTAVGNSLLVSFGNEDLKTLLWRLLVERRISTISDIVVLDNEDVSDLILMSWWSRVSSSKDTRREALHSFDTQFLQNIRYSWFLNPKQEQRLLIIRGLTTSTATVYVALPEHQDSVGSALLFQVNSQDRAILETAIMLLRQSSIFCSWSVKLQEKGAPFRPGELGNILKHLNVRLAKGDKESMDISSMARGSQDDSGKGEWSVTSWSRREVLDSRKIVFEVPIEEVWFVDEAKKSLTRALEFDIPTAERILQESPKDENDIYILPIVRLKNVPGLESRSVWHSIANFKEADIPANPMPLLNEYQNKLRGKILPLFEYPREFLNALDERNKPLSKQHPTLIASVNSTRDVREAVWQQVSVGLDLSTNKEAPILLIKNVGGTTTSIQTRNRIDWSFLLLHIYLKLRLAEAKRPNEILISESKAGGSEAGTISIFVLPGAE